MKSYFVDTSVIIDYLKGKKDTIQLLNTLDGRITSSYICLAELYDGIFRVTNKNVREQELKTYWEGFSEIYTVDGEIAKKFGELRADLKQKGMVIEDIDLFIAATCIVHDEILVTENVKHFERIKELEIYE